MEKKLITYFKPLKKIVPDEQFLLRSKRYLNATPKTSMASFKRGMWEDLKFGTALVVASGFAILAVAFYSNLGISTVVRGTPNQEDLLRESQSLEFNIELGEATYFEDSAEAVAAALDEISESEHDSEENN